MAVDGVGEKARPLDGWAAGVTRGSCHLVGGSFHLLKPPEPRVMVNRGVWGEDESVPCLKSAS